eukprot:TRINITY_DN8657_c0_g1_i1.p1 TRINITY_DN8657_c0_g1~~TRINITY_DN8657_c0_g1_i1.p1  ORF type:complete len:163 (+),score=8.94 TRINITY_DN8657_c0_g1_i1:84-572(+)
MPFSLSALESEESEEQAACFPTLTFSERIKGFVICCAAGLLCSVMSWITLAVGKYVKYSVFMTLGNLISLMSSGFLVGPKRQLQTLFDEKRRTTSIVYICTLVGTLVAAFAFHSAPLAVFCCLIQYAAFIWYCLSFIPYGRRMALSFLKGLGKCCYKATIDV